MRMSERILKLKQKLIGSLHGQKMAFHTELLKWYLQKGIKHHTGRQISKSSTIPEFHAAGYRSQTKG